MKTTCDSRLPAGRIPIPRPCIAVLEGVLCILVSAVVLADIPDAARPVGIPRIEGIYKVVSSTDPMLPATRTSELFLDFGRGIHEGAFSGSVAISLRQNPHVKVRIMAWQYFPQHGALVIGNPCFDGARQAVARGMWRIKGTGGDVVLERDNRLVVLRRADPRDY